MRNSGERNEMNEMLMVLLRVGSELKWTGFVKIEEALWALYSIQMSSDPFPRHHHNHSIFPHILGIKGEGIPFVQHVWHLSILRQ